MSEFAQSTTSPPSPDIRVVTWNVLADCYVHGQTVLENTDFDCRKWPVRSVMIEKCLQAFDADVMCLQEVDHFESFYRPTLKAMGYKSLFLKRPSKHDGCLTCFRSDRFHLVGTKELNLDALSFIDGDRKSSKSKFFKNNVALFAALRDLSTGRVFIVANCHIHWNPSLEDVKIAQVAFLLEQLAEFRADSEHAPILWMGDFNSLPHSDIYRIITADVSHRHNLLQDISPLHIARSIGTGQTAKHNPYYGAHTRFLCDASLAKLCRWMRMLGVQVACDSYDVPSPAEAATLPAHATGRSSKALKASYINAFFDKANNEQRVLLTTSKTLLERNTCPRHSRYVDPAKQAQEVIALFHEYGLQLSRDRFLTVCGKCGGEIAVANANDPRMSGKYMPTDREVYACVHCAHPYWWNDEENSSPAKALRKAEELYQMIASALGRPIEKPRPTPTTATRAETEAIAKRDDISLLNELRETAAKEATAAAAAATTDDDTAMITADLTAMSLSTAEDVAEAVEMPEEFRLASQLMRQRSVDALPALVSVFHPEAADGKTPTEAEPAATNWAGEFIGTLDYIFATEDDWDVHWARVRPLASLNATHGQSNLPLVPRYRTADGEGTACDDASSIDTAVSEAQPSPLWPSDHFAIVAELATR